MTLNFRQFRTQIDGVYSFHPDAQFTWFLVKEVELGLSDHSENEIVINTMDNFWTWQGITVFFGWP